MSNAPRDGHNERIPARVLDVLLAKTKRSNKAKTMIRECMVDGKPYHVVAKANGVSRQYVWEACQALLSDYRATL
jgi:hypothetical protein